MLAANTLGTRMHGPVPALWLRLCTPVPASAACFEPTSHCPMHTDGQLLSVPDHCQHIRYATPLRTPVLDPETLTPCVTAMSAMQATNGSWSEALTEPLQAMVVWQPIRVQKGLTSPAPVSIADCLAGQARLRSFALRSDRRRTRSLLSRVS